MRQLVVATRSPHKLREIREILSPLTAVAVAGLEEVGIARDADEEGIEIYHTFEANSLAKARYFADRVDGWVLADDSGLCVDALGGAPGVHSRRFAAQYGKVGLEGELLDRANNDLLLERLEGISPSERSAHYVCAVALIGPSGEEHVCTGACDGLILSAPAGRGGFGYDPLFFVPEANATFGELPAEYKNRVSHRARALRAAADTLRGLVDSNPSRP